MKPVQQDLQSQVIDFLRFPLIVGVVFIHNHSSTVTMPGVELGSENYMPMFYTCSNLFSQVLGRIAVPLFFFISGFLFFLNVNFNKLSYLKKLKNRFRTLLTPYLFWNIATLALFLTLANIPQTKMFISRNMECHLPYILKALWAIEDSPFSYQFWFIRDLMVTVLLTPFIYLIVKKTSVYGVSILGILWFFGWWFDIPGVGIVSIFFFTLGAWFSINKRNLVEDMSCVKRLPFVLYPLIVVVDLLTKEHEFNAYIHQAGILVGIVFCFNLVASMLNAGKIRVSKFLSSAAFFVFAIHEPLLASLRKITFMIFNPSTDVMLTILYFFNVITIVALTLMLYFLLRRFMPRFTRFITGGR
jgi:surface polysaccharide O-acyltransferase-like enzyme